VKLTAISVALMLALSSQSAIAADDKSQKKKKKEKSIAAMIKDKTHTKGLLNFYLDEKTGKNLLILEESQLDTPILYFAHTVDGLADAGHFRGGYRDNKIIEFRRYFDRVDVITKTPRYLFDENNPLSRSKNANISESVLASLKIEKNEKGQIALKVDSLFLGEALHKISPWSRPGDKMAKKRFKPGKVNSKKSRILSKRTYPHNVDVVVNYVFSNPNPSVSGSNAVTDPRSTSVTVQHSFVKLPETGFKPRFDDARVGYFTHEFDQMTSSKWAPYQDVIKRWNLVKKEPAAEISEPVEPIVWWIENTTPLEWRESIKTAVLSWNSAFEKAGFKNAMEVKIQPDDANWDAGDISYNVLRWTSSPNPRFGGYGPSLANPLTGEMLGADIMLEFVFMKNRWIYDNLYTQGAMSLNNDVMPSNTLNCSAGHQMQQGLMLGHTMTQDNEVDNNELLDQALQELIMHEVGHTLGLNHNMKASILWDEKEVHDQSKTQGILTGSVMDYTPINIAPTGIKQGDYYQTKPGPYDDWAIEYGYSSALVDAAAEQQRLNKILSRSGEHGLAFGNDADDMRSPGRHIDPRVMIGDMSSNPVAYGVDRMNLINELFSSLKDKSLSQGGSYQPLLISVNSLYGQYRAQANVISRQIGGVYVERNFVDSTNSTTPYTPVPKEIQKAAMHALSTHVFANDTLSTMTPLYNYLQHQRRGFNHYGKNEDPKAHDLVLNLQKSVLSQLLHPAVLKRISDTSLYGNDYSLNEVLNDLTAAIFTKESTLSHNVQIDYVRRLSAITGLVSGSKYDNLAKAAALGQLQSIHDSATKLRFSQSDAQKAQNSYLALLIEKVFKA